MFIESACDGGIQNPNRGRVFTKDEPEPLTDLDEILFDESVWPTERSHLCAAACLS